jgi:hypothetical protein
VQPRSGSYQAIKCCIADVRLSGQPELVQARIARLLRPLPETALPRDSSRITIIALLALTLVIALVLGLICGEPVIRPLLAPSS